MKRKLYTLIFITLLIVSTPAFAQILIILKDVSSIEVEAVRYENNQCIYTQNGTEKSVSLDLIEEIYVLNEGRIYPPQLREPQQTEPAQTQENESINDEKQTYERNNEKKKSEGNATIKDKVAPVEQTYLYKPPQGFFQCEIPKSWNHMEMGGSYMFSPYPLNSKDVSKTMVQIHRIPGQMGITTFSKEHKAKMMAQLEKLGEKLLLERERVIDGIETWEKFLEATKLGPSLKHEIMLVHSGYFVSVTLEASPELFQSADIQFERILESLKFF